MLFSFLSLSHIMLSHLYDSVYTGIFKFIIIYDHAVCNDVVFVCYNMGYTLLAYCACAGVHFVAPPHGPPCIVAIAKSNDFGHPSLHGICYKVAGM